MYRINPDYDEVGVWTQRIVDHRQYSLYNSWNPIKFLPYEDEEFTNTTYAFGLVANPFKSNIAILDFDYNPGLDITSMLDFFTNIDWVKEIDIAISSRDALTLMPLGHHIYLGLDGLYNILKLYELDIPNACQGFNNCILGRHEIVIRVSKKFKSLDKNTDTNIIWHSGYSRKDNDTWLRYKSEQLIAPLTTADGPSLNMTQSLRRPRLQLRG